MIQPMSAALRGYIHAFDLHAVCQYSDGRIAVSSNPAGAVAAYWCEGRRDAGFIAKLAIEGRMSVPDAARRLNLRIAPHEHVVARATAAVARLNDSLARAQNNGLMRSFNAQYRAQRQAARLQSRGYMSYSQARGRLLRELFKVAASGGKAPPAGLIAKVFAGR